MMGWQTGDQRQLFYLFNLERRIPASHLLRRINPIVMQVLADLREKLAPFYSDIGRPSIDPELLIRMLIVGYCYGIRFERRLCEEVELATAANWANSATGPKFCDALEIWLHRHHAATVKRCPHDPLNDWQRGRTSDHRKPAISCDRRRLQPHLFHGRTRRPQRYSPPLRDDARRAHASKDPPGLRCKSRIPGSCARRNEGAVSRLHFFGLLGRRPGKMNPLNWTLPSHEFSVQSRWAVGFAPASGKDRAAVSCRTWGLPPP